MTHLIHHLLLPRSISRPDVVHVSHVRSRFHCFSCFMLLMLLVCCSTGGVVLTNKDGTIVCSNTLDDRLKIAYAQNLPDIRAALFGIEAPARA